MNSKTLHFAVALAVIGVCAQPLIASAAQGDWLVRGGLGYVDPKDNNLDLDGTDLQVDEAVSLTVEGTYMFRTHWGVELLAAWPFEHDVSIDGVGDVAEIDHLPPTLSLQYHFNPEGTFRPYVGVGVNYTTFTREEEQGALEDGFRLELDDSVGVAGQVGADVTLADNWFANFAVRYIDLEADAELNGADLGSVEVDPLVYQVQAGYRFRRASPAPAPAPVPVAAAPPPARAAPADADGDRITDDTDLCPETPRGERVGTQGCSCAVTRQVQFVFDSAELTADGKATLDDMAAQLARLQFVSGTVVGHADSLGSDAYNLDLSRRRAVTVADYLQSKGVAAGRMTAIGKGESQPIADNGTVEGRALNRRVVIARSDCDASS